MSKDQYRYWDENPGWQEKLSHELDGYCDSDHDKFWILWSVQQFTLTEKTVFMDEALCWLHRANAPVTTTMQKLLFEAAIFRLYHNKNIGTPKQADDARELLLAMVQMAAIIGHSKTQRQTVTVKAAANRVAQDFKQFSIDTLADSWARTLTKSQKDTLLKHGKGLLNSSEETIELILSNLPKRP
jgi:hypothetical protein